MRSSGSRQKWEIGEKRPSGPSLKLLDQNGSEVVNTSNGIEINILMLDGVVPAMVEWQFTE